jgi:hypothetical protein
MLILALVALAVLAALLVFSVERRVDSLVDVVLRKIGLASGSVEILGSAQMRNNEVIVFLENHGVDAFHLAALVAADVNGRKLFPIPSRVVDSSLDGYDEKTARQELSKIKIVANSTLELGFGLDTFAAMQLQSFGAMDTNGKSWPIDISAVAGIII